MKKNNILGIVLALTLSVTALFGCNQPAHNPREEVEPVVLIPDNNPPREDDNEFADGPADIAGPAISNMSDIIEDELRNEEVENFTEETVEPVEIPENNPTPDVFVDRFDH